VIGGSEPLRAGIDTVFATHRPVQRCRNHKVENVMGCLPDELKDQVKAVMKAACRPPNDKGMARLRQQASGLEQECAAAAAIPRDPPALWTGRRSPVSMRFPVCPAGTVCCRRACARRHGRGVVQ
jgi:hypothetical protein